MRKSRPLTCSDLLLRPHILQPRAAIVTSNIVPPIPTDTPIIVFLDFEPDLSALPSLGDDVPVGPEAGTVVAAVDSDTEVTALPDTVTIVVTSSTLCETDEAGRIVVEVSVLSVLAGGS